MDGRRLEADTVVVGGGSAGAVVAGRLAERSSGSVLLLEAGPDYGARTSGAWPPELLDARAVAQVSHGWSYVSAATHGARELPLERARVIGGCSSHNGCAAIWGHRDDFDGWARLGNPGWDAASLRPLLAEVNERLRVHTPTADTIGPFHEAVLAAAPGVGLPVVDDLNDLDGGIGMGISPINVVDGTRWNSAFAYLDPVRNRANLRFVGEALVDRVLIESGRAVGVVALGAQGPFEVRARRVVLAGGAYGSPAVLLRSGVGPPDDLRALGTPIVHALPGVGANLHDHPAFLVHYRGTAELIERLERFASRAPLREEGTIAKARSALCAGPFDLHLYPIGSPYWKGDGTWMFVIPVANMTPLSRGSLRLDSRDPEAPPRIDHAYLTDPEDKDLTVLLDGVDLARALGASSPLAGLLGDEVLPGPECLDREALGARVRAEGVHYYHPVGTCKMGPSTEVAAVVDAAGRVHGLDGLWVADASIMPVIPRANTNVPALVVGEKIALALLQDERRG